MSTPARPRMRCSPANALHQLPDLWKVLALDGIAKLLRPGGVLRLRDLIFDFQPAEAEAVFDAWLVGSAEGPDPGLIALGIETNPAYLLGCAVVPRRAEGWLRYARRCRSTRVGEAPAAPCCELAGDPARPCS